jgi:hypothetical protein
VDEFADAYDRRFMRNENALLFEVLLARRAELPDRAGIGVPRGVAGAEAGREPPVQGDEELLAPQRGIRSVVQDHAVRTDQDRLGDSEDGERVGDVVGLIGSAAT